MSILLEREASSVVEFNKVNWSQDYNQAVDKDAFIDKFIGEFLKANNINSGIGFKDALHKQLEVFGGEGMNEGLNPFLTWMIKYDKTVGGLNNISDEAYNNLNSLYGNKVIFEKELRGTSTLGTKTILFNSDFFTKNDTDFTYIAQIFYYLNSNYGKEKFLKKIKGLKGSQKYEFTQRLKANFSSFFTDKLYKDPEVAKYFMVFKDNKYSPSGELREARDIDLSITYLDTQVEDTEEQNNKNREVNKESSKISSEFKSNLEDVKKALLEMGKEEKLVDSLLNVIIRSGGYENATSNEIINTIIDMTKTIRRG